MANLQEINIAEDIIPGGLLAPCDLDAVCSVSARDPADGDTQMGGGCVFIHRTWVLTVKHILQRSERLLPEVEVRFMDGTSQRATVLLIEPSADLAILELETPAPCDYPLLPGNLDLLRPYGLVQLAFWQTQNEADNSVDIELRISPVANVDYSIRPGTNERLVIMDIPNGQRGNSGGPIIGQGGGVVAMTSQRTSDDRRATTGTDVAPIVLRLQLNLQAQEGNLLLGMAGR